MIGCSLFLAKNFDIMIVFTAEVPFFCYVCMQESEDSLKQIECVRKIQDPDEELLGKLCPLMVVRINFLAAIFLFPENCDL